MGLVAARALVSMLTSALSGVERTVVVAIDVGGRSIANPIAPTGDLAVAFVVGDPRIAELVFHDPHHSTHLRRLEKCAPGAGGARSSVCGGCAVCGRGPIASSRASQESQPWRGYWAQDCPRSWFSCSLRARCQSRRRHTGPTSSQACQQGWRGCRRWGCPHPSRGIIRSGRRFIRRCG